MLEPLSSDLVKAVLKEIRRYQCIGHLQCTCTFVHGLEKDATNL